MQGAEKGVRGRGQQPSSPPQQCRVALAVQRSALPSIWALVLRIESPFISILWAL